MAVVGTSIGGHVPGSCSALSGEARWLKYEKSCRMVHGDGTLARVSSDGGRWPCCVQDRTEKRPGE